MFCHNCGHRNPPGVNFCSSCGVALAPNTDTTVSFIPEESTGELGDEELGVEVGELANGTGVLVVKRGPESGAKFVLDNEHAVPSASSPTSTPSSSSPSSPVDSSGMNETVVSVFGASATPQDEQKFTPGGLRCPQL